MLDVDVDVDWKPASFHFRFSLALDDTSKQRCDEIVSRYDDNNDNDADVTGTSTVG